MRSVLISIQPKWVEKIVSDEKTIEVRKSKPKIEPPFKCYIYCSEKDYEKVFYRDRFMHKIFLNGNAKGKVIGEFVCDKINCSQAYFDSQGKNHLTNVFPEDIKKTCLTEYELWNYIAGKAVKANEMYDGWLWHISDLKIYDKPKELSKFYKPCAENANCYYCEKSKINCNGRITRPFYSWGYVEEL